jgi:hypothetical protein
MTTAPRIAPAQATEEILAYLDEVIEEYDLDQYVRYQHLVTVGRLLANMQDKDATMVVPTLRPQDTDMQRRPWCDPENFNPGYVMRSQHILFKQGDREPWTHMLEHEQEREILPETDLDDGTLVYR